jgi:hypothetical protein
MDRIFEDIKEHGRQDGQMRKQDWALSALLVSAKSGGKSAKAKDAQGSQEEVPRNSQEEDRS